MVSPLVHYYVGCVAKLALMVLPSALTQHNGQGLDHYVGCIAKLVLTVLPSALLDITCKGSTIMLGILPSLLRPTGLA
jgi:hypothetical protein